MIKKVLSTILSLSIIALCPLTAFAMVATPSDAMKVPVATSSNALPSQDYMETDDFDTLDVMPLSDGDNYTSTVDLSKVQYFYRYKDSAGQLRTETGHLTSEGYFSVPLLADYSSTEYCLFSLDKSVIPNPGKYSVSVHFGSNTGGFTYDGFQVEYIQSFKSANTKYTQLGVNAVQSSGDYSYDTTLQIDSSVTRLTFISKFKPPAPLPYGGYFSVSFTRLNNASDVGFSPPSFTTSDDINQNIADNTGQIVEKQDTIIDQIMDVTQTISSQLTAFWNQLAGEFTNLYNKMNQQHQESMDKVDDQIDNDNANTDKVTTAIEAHGNFIIEGLKSLFIPSNEYFKSWFDGMYQFFNDRLGFLMLPVDLLVRMVDIYTSAGSSSAGIPFPEFKWMDGTVIIPAQTVQFDFLNTDWGKGIQDKLYFVGNLIMIGALLSLMHRKFEEVLRN